MEHHGSRALSWTGVFCALVGTVRQEQLLTFASLVLTLAVHFWNGRAGKLQKLTAELEYWKGRAYALDGRADQLAAEIKELKQAKGPVAIAPPFLPGEASCHS
jgi:hypothetical protein